MLTSKKDLSFQGVVIMLELKQLRQEAYSSWTWLQSSHSNLFEGIGDCPDREEYTRLPYVDAGFKDEIRSSYGDLRCRETWEQAAISLTARKIAELHLDPYQIVGYLASSKYLQCTIRQHYGDQLIETLLKFPEVLEVLQDGLEHLYHVSNCAADREIAQKFVKKITHRLWPRATAPTMSNF
jgi:hypothetical protein